MKGMYPSKTRNAIILPDYLPILDARPANLETILTR